MDDKVNINGRIFPKSASRTDLERIGARHLKTDQFKAGGLSKSIEYMVIEDSYMAVWKRSNEGNQNYELHLLAPGVIKFPVLV